MRSHKRSRTLPGIVRAAMPSFKVGDHVERIGVVPGWMKVGVITKVIPSKHGIEWATQYEVVFGEIKGTFYETELCLLTPLASRIESSVGRRPET